MQDWEDDNYINSFKTTGTKQIGRIFAFSFLNCCMIFVLLKVNILGAGEIAES